MKICSKCKVEKDESEFGLDKSKKSGLDTRCRLCNRNRQGYTGLRRNLSEPIICGDITFIPLGHNNWTIIDTEDLLLVRDYIWCLNNDGYAVGHINGKIVRMHRLIMRTPEGMQVDHISHIKIDNRKINLRNCTQSENQHNLMPKIGGTSIYKGVYWKLYDKKWEAHIRINGKRLYLGLFDLEIDAARVYNKAAIELFGEYARINIL